MRRYTERFRGRGVETSWRFLSTMLGIPPWRMVITWNIWVCLFFFERAFENLFYECPPNDETTRSGPCIGRRSVLGYDQSGHIPNVTPSDRQQRAPHDKEGTLGSAKGFGPWTFGWGEVSRTGGEVSRNAGTFKPTPGFEPTSWFRGGKASQFAWYVRLVRS